jgi:hypothetical protein
MKSIQSTVLLSDLTKLTQELVQKASKSFGKLSQNQLNWRPNPDTWSINQLFAHLNTYADFYHTTILNRIEKTRFNEPKDIFVSSPLGRSAWKSVKLGNLKNVKRKFRSARDYNPVFNGKAIRENELDGFIERQEEMIAILTKSAQVNLRKVKVPNALSKIVKLRLGDCLLFVVYHNERHVYQALNLLKHPAFPKK